MQDRSAPRALALSAAALALAVGACASFVLPPLGPILGSLPRGVGAPLVLAVTALLHWAWLVSAARRLRLPVAGPLALSVLLFPVGSVAALLLLAWPRYEPDTAAA